MTVCRISASGNTCEMTHNHVTSEQLYVWWWLSFDVLWFIKFEWEKQFVYTRIYYSNWNKYIDLM